MTNISDGRTFVWLAGAVFCVAGAVACQQPAPRAPDATRVYPNYDKTTGQLKRLEYDSDGDGKIDTWGYMDGTRVVRVEVDENGDGKVDRWEYHRQAVVDSRQSSVDSRPSSADSRQSSVASRQSTNDQRLATNDFPERIERATRHDGVVSRWEYFDNGSLVRVEEDTDGDGKVDKWETYSGGSLSLLAMDTEHRGKPNRRLVYRPDGALDRIEADPTGSGQFQVVTP